MKEYPRITMENYGASTVELIELDMSNKDLTNLYIDGKKILMPILNLSDYDSNCHCYAFIERLKKYSITMIDLLYTYNEIAFDNEIFREDFLREYTRSNINLCTMSSPGIIVNPNSNRDKNCFWNAIRLSIENSVDNNIVLASTKTIEKVEVEEEPKKVKEDNVVLQFMKILYKSMGGTLRKIELPKKKYMDCVLEKNAIFIKSGEIITNNIQTGKYLSKFVTRSVVDENSTCLENNMLKNIKFIKSIDLMNFIALKYF